MFNLGIMDLKHPARKDLMGRRWRVVVREVPVKVIEIRDRKHKGLAGYRLYRVGGHFVLTVFAHDGDFIYEPIIDYGYDVVHTLMNAIDDLRGGDDEELRRELKHILTHYLDKLRQAEERVVDDRVIADADS